MKRQKITFRVAPWRTMQTPTQRDRDALLEAICDQRTRLSRERLAKLRGSTQTTAGAECAQPTTN